MDNDRLTNAAAAAFDFHYHRDRMNSATHMAAVRFSPITFELAAGLAAAGKTGETLDEVNAHAGKYPQDRGREMIQ